ncbi:TRAP transporter substrate-binding protein [Marinobacterium sedimentorum]|uniref:TRAP transporter substrate-binding protein n=1 Tax=Marinobacterium sedimentorum TaxID=2927804 RepID=UPI0020C68785|nr:TRAP transporter substrate-binding protein [Marinobacterium sedimentorum]MCP8687032.1 TRAP transporter substrate-binding protein [Marinobacterium sedimentorum]
MKKVLQLGITLTLALGSLAAQAEATRLTMSSWLPSGHPLVTDVFKPWIDDVKTATQGRVEIVLLPAPLGHPKMHYDIVRDGQADIAYSVSGYTPGRFKLTEMFELPFSGDSAEATSVAAWTVYQKYFAKAGEYKDVQLLGLFTNGAGQLHNSQHAVRRMADVDGMKLRVAGGAAKDIVEALGAVPLQKPVSSSYELISNGVADGTLFPVESVLSFNLQDITRYTTSVPGGLFNTTLFLAMNKERFSSLSAEDQAAIMAVSGEAFSHRSGRMFDLREAEVTQALRKNGNEIDVADAAFVDEIRTATAPITQEWLDDVKDKGVDVEAAMVEYLELVH